MKLIKVQNHGHEHEFEPQPGLPEALPAGERLLWQGSPDWRMLARQAFHTRALSVYFALLVVWQVAHVARSGDPVLEMVKALGWTVGLSAVALGLVLTLAWLTARTTVYTLTDKRVVMRVGIVLTMTFNLPLKRIASAGLRLDKGSAQGTGDIPLELMGNVRIPLLQIWPHARPWKVSQPHPMLRSVPDAARVAAQLGTAWQAVTGVPVDPVTDAAAVASPVPAQPLTGSGSAHDEPRAKGNGRMATA